LGALNLLMVDSAADRVAFVTAFIAELTLTQAVGYGKSLCDAQTSQSREAKTRKR
jgi:hypothetical protein